MLRFVFFFFNDTATTEIYTLSLHDALPISSSGPKSNSQTCVAARGYSRPHSRHLSAFMNPELFCIIVFFPGHKKAPSQDRKSTRLNSSHSQISYAVFCLKKKNKSFAYTTRC